MTRYLLCGAAIAFLFSCVSGRAADLSRKAPPAAPAFNWSGFYLGVEGGGAVGRSNQIASGPFGFGSLTSTYDIRGGIVGGTVGYSVQSGPWVYGLEGDGSWMDATGGGHEIAPFTKSTIDTTTMHWLATGRGRLGWAYKDTMLYGTGGVAAAGVEAGIQTAAFGDFTNEQTRWGYAVGGGIEAKIAQGWTLKGEYLYVDFASQGYFNPAPAAGINIRSDVPVYSHILRLGLNYHFLLQ